MEKGPNPFVPHQPVNREMFVGREVAMQRILDRWIGRVESGTPWFGFVQGEYGIGKSSLARVMQWVAQDRGKLHPIYVSMGSVETVEDLGTALLRATIEARAVVPTRAEALRSWLARYVGEQSLLGVTLRADQLRADGPSVAEGVLPFFEQVLARLRPSGATGLFVVLDEINGIANNPRFAHFLKGLSDLNAFRPVPVPLLLVLCGTSDRRRELVRNHEPVARIFDIIELGPLGEGECSSFFGRAFEAANLRATPKALDILSYHSDGMPRVMHILGDCAYWADDDGEIGEKDAVAAIMGAAFEIGQKYVDQQVVQALRSRDYQAILRKLGGLGLDMVFRKADLASRLEPAELRKFDAFLRKLRDLGVVRFGTERGEYEVTSRMARIYLFLESGSPQGA